MKKPNYALTLWLLLLVSSQAFAQATVSGVTMPATFKAGNDNLVLNGAGVRVKFFMDMYVAGLYLPAKANVAESICQANTPMAVNLHIVSSLVSSDRMVDAIKEGFKKSTGDKTGPIQSKIDRFIKLFTQEPIVKGNEFDNIYVPGEGVKVYKNGKLLDTIDGMDFKTALWGIWLGNEPADKNLKVALLGGK
jgi:hypothetical protein